MFTHVLPARRMARTNTRKPAYGRIDLLLPRREGERWSEVRHAMAVARECCVLGRGTHYRGATTQVQNRVTVGVPVALARRLQHATLQRATMGSSSMDSATSSASESSPSQKRDESQPLLHSPARQ